MLYRSDHRVGIMFKSSQVSHVIPLTGAPAIEVGTAIPSFVSLRAASLPRAVAFLPYRLNCLHRPLCHHLAILLTIIALFPALCAKNSHCSLSSHVWGAFVAAGYGRKKRVRAHFLIGFT